MVGFDSRNKYVLDPKFLCPICGLILRDPVQFSECGHHACLSCPHIDHSMIIQCPECLTENQRNQIRRDRGFERDMRSLPVRIECPYCNWVGVLNNYQTHLDNAHPNPFCQYCHQPFDTVTNLVEHQVVQCQGIHVNCLLKDFGCDTPVACCRMEEHYRSEKHQHTLQKLIYRMVLHRQNNLYQSTTVGAVDVGVIPWQELCELLNVSLNYMDILNNGGRERLNNALRLCQLRSPNLTLDFLKAKLSIEATNRSLYRQIYNPVINIENPIRSTEPNASQQYISYDGTFLWRITNVSERIVDAQSGRQSSIYSPPFYSSPLGYKMRARLYLYGNGDARRTHMSLFFVLMRNEHDSILTFPFSYRVTFCLFDQTRAQRHIIDSFRPDIRSNSFQRPKSEMNIASGIPKFLPLTMIEQEGNPYVQDDTMFIKIMVDFGDMPRTLVPYALSLNPGLPTRVQQILIAQEAERRRRQQIGPISDSENETMSKEEVS